jgi:TolB protein
MRMAWAVVAALGACTKPNYVECADTAACSYLAGGVCQLNPATGNQWCAAPDATCSSGLRWDDIAVGDGLSGMCVDGGPPDGPAVCRPKLAWRTDRDMGSTPDMHVYVSDADGTNQFNVSPEAGTIALQHEWSPTGGAIAFSRVTFGSTGQQIWVASLDGTVDRSLTSAANDSQPTWTADGQRVYFQRERPTQMNRFDIWSVGVDANGLMQVSSDVTRSDSSPTWSSRASKLAVVSFAGTTGDIFVMESDGANRLNLTNHATATTVADPQWSPDGTRIIFVSDASGDNEIWKVEVDGDNLTNLTQQSDNDSHPRWFPDGSRILFARGAAASRRLWVMNVDGSGQRPTNVMAPDGADGEVSPDGTQIAWTAIRGGIPDIYIGNNEGLDQTPITEDASYDDSPLWQPCP